MAEEHDCDAEQHLPAAQVTRDLIGQAQNILMKRFQMTAEQASALLTQACQDANVDPRDVAQRLIDTQETVGR